MNQGSFHEQSDNYQDYDLNLEKKREITDFTSTKSRFLMLFLGCCLCLGTYYVHDNPAPLNLELIDELDINSVKYNMFYSVYSFPNIFLPLLGGFLIDSFGVRSLVLISSSFSMLGQLIFAIGVQIRSYPLSLVGRAVYGLGGDNLELAQNIILIEWFTGKELSMAIGINTSICFFGAVLNENLEPILVKYTSVPFTIWIGFIACLFSLICSCFVTKLDRKQDPYRNASQIFSSADSEKFKLSDVKTLPLCYWMLLLNCLMVESIVMCFSNITSGYLQVRFNFDPVSAGNIMSIVFIVCTIASPLVGMIIDKIGKRILMLIISSFMFMIIQIAFALTPDQNKPILPMIFLGLNGLAYSTYITVFWTCIPFIVEEKVIGTAYGGCYSCVNLGFFVIPMLIGYIQENTSSMHGYLWVNVLLIVLGFIGILTAFVVYRIDINAGRILDSEKPTETQQQILTKRGSQDSSDIELVHLANPSNTS
ncbi:hypothetical protein SteCoe_8635 [Stentor coeruleus]|uniref:Lysosomal dipeptide transporter MFSD1 n=1 Tax=Stentor coeruleus TaxID=5963 RepID=A0A1R2CJS0_9CILI|nr:hypothetical protein SteCoe_8635 [Stentor coeruleus]